MKLQSNVKGKKISFSTTMPVLTPKSTFSMIEAFKAIRTNLIFALASQNSRIVLVTSALPGEGKTTASVNLAISMAQTGTKVLLIDADLRKPMVHKALNIKNDLGLSEVLGGFCKLLKALHHSVMENLDVLTSGAIPPNPAELLSSGAMVTFLEYCKESYDYIFFDTPPVNVVADALALAPFVSGILLVVKEGKTVHPELKKAISSIEFSGTKILGVVLNASQSISKNGHKYKY